MVTTFYPPDHFGGDALCVYRLTEELARRGHEVEVICSADAYAALGGRGQGGGYPHDPKVTVHRLRSRLPVLSSLLTHQTGAPAFGREIRSILDAKKFDVIHYHNISLIGIEALGYGTAVKLYTLHEHWLVCPMHVLWKFDREVCTEKNCLPCTLAGKRPPQLWRYTGLLRRSLRQIDRFIAPSRFVMERHRADGLDLPMTHLPHFLPRPDAAARPVKHARPYFLFAGRLEKIKGLQQVIPLFGGRPAYDLLIAGAGGYERELRELSAGSTNVHFLGRLTPEELTGLYRGAIAVVIPSVCYEVFGMTSIEAFAVGTPVIVNNLGALPEVVEASGGGIIYNSPAEMGAAIDRLGADRGLRDELGRRGREAYLKYWTAERHLEQYFELIAGLRHGRSNPDLPLD